MTSEECHLRATACAVSAGLACDVMVASEFMALAALWRAMAVRDGFLGSLTEPAAAVFRAGSDG
ncbi:hypothetical protein ACO2Q3_21455 [Caulobacter sp. KR2-114]|uniref:hypothetical protein n=1 Tax=Caulobacter sp. KR2-114 TaxID=3400912 RepID=UPI003C03AB26